MNTFAGSQCTVWETNFAANNKKLYTSSEEREILREQLWDDNRPVEVAAKGEPGRSEVRARVNSAADSDRSSRSSIIIIY